MSLRRVAYSQVRRITYDWSPPEEPGPEPHDVLETVSNRTHEPTGTRYRIIGVRDVRTRRPIPGIRRMALSVVRLLGDPSPADRRFRIRWYRRGEYPS